VDPSRPKRSLADDAKFVDSLSTLDDGLDPSSSEPLQPAQSARGKKTTPFQAAVQPPAAQNEPPIVIQPGSKRPLIDLFPPSPSEAPAGPLPLPPRGTAPPPRLARSGIRRAPVPAAPRPDTYETFYGLSEKPFALGPDPRFLYHSVAHDQASQELLDAIHRRAGVAVLTAPAGQGKTTLCRAVLDQLDRRTLTSLVNESVVSFEQLVGTLLVDFGVLSRAELLQHADGADLIKTLRSFVASLHSLQANAVVIVDEAQLLPVPVLRDLAAFAADTHPVVQLVLSGQPDLATLLSRSELQDLHNQIVARPELGALAEDEVPGYVMYRLSVAGRQPRVEFDDEAFRLLSEISQGNPRAVNQLCDRALTRGFDRAASVIDRELLQIAADELGLSAAATRPAGIMPWIIVLAAALTLMGLGAAAAAWMFSDRLQQMVGAWR
jgi:type II secretory pathway predicted ATPase ExeA